MVGINEDIYIVTKAPNSGTSTVYLKPAPHFDGSNYHAGECCDPSIRERQSPGQRSAMAGDISVSGNEAIIRTYAHIFM